MRALRGCFLETIIDKGKGKAQEQIPVRGYAGVLAVPKLEVYMTQYDSQLHFIIVKVQSKINQEKGPQHNTAVSDGGLDANNFREAEMSQRL